MSPAQRRSNTSAAKTAVLVTGCSSGIGHAVALRMSRHDEYTVFASARRVETLNTLEAAGCRTLECDVTSEESMSSAVRLVEEEAGSVGALVNNAGYGLYGAVEQIPLDEIRRQFETNVVGLVRMIQLVLPGMRRVGSGRIINVSSIGGRTTLPGGAMYHGSKFAVEAISDVLRLEVAPFGVHVSLIEPAGVRTPWSDVAAESLLADVGADDPYEAYKGAVHRMLQGASSSRIASRPETIARVIERAIVSSRPRTRYLVGLPANALILFRHLLPDWLYDAALRAQLGIGR